MGCLRPHSETDPETYEGEKFLQPAAAAPPTCCKMPQTQHLLTTPESILLWQAWSSLLKCGVVGETATMQCLDGSRFQLYGSLRSPNLNCSVILAGQMIYIHSPTVHVSVTSPMDKLALQASSPSPCPQFSSRLIFACIISPFLIQLFHRRNPSS